MPVVVYLIFKLPLPINIKSPLLYANEPLKATDTEVKAHENAHKAAAGGLRTSAPNYEYETGPDGKKYAVV